MKKNKLGIFTVAISIAVISLILVQLYWVNNAFRLKQDQFKQQVNQSLRHVAEVLEKRETVEKLKSHQQARYLFFQPDSVTDLKLPPDSGYDMMVQRTIVNDGKNIEIFELEETDGKSSYKTITRSANDEALTMEEKAMDQPLEFNLSPSSTRPLVMVETKQNNIDSIIQSRMSQKTALVGDIVKSLMEVNLNEKIENRINVAELDSLLKTELNQQGITTKFEFGVFSKSLDIVLGNVEKCPEPLKTSLYKASLFPNDIIQHNYLLKIHFPHERGFLIKTMWAMMLTSILIIVAIIGGFYFSISTIIRQKQISEIKNDFINNMTHELKTPISTISLACEALKDPDLAGSETIVQRYIGMISDENKRLGLLVESVLKSAVLEKGEFKLKLKETNMHQLIESLSEKMLFQVKEKQGSLALHLNAENPVIMGDEVHLTNVINNLIDNAIKYCEQQPNIELFTKSDLNGIYIDVKDNGIGISPENQQKVFDKLYRVPTGNVHNVKGFGLGLRYVKIITEKHGGTVTLKSKLNQGSTFSVFLPFKNIE